MHTIEVAVRQVCSINHNRPTDHLGRDRSVQENGADRIRAVPRRSFPAPQVAEGQQTDAHAGIGFDPAGPTAASLSNNKLPGATQVAEPLRRRRWSSLGVE
jgi:hypothetical protein